MTDYAEHMAEDRRGAILHLMEAADGTATESLLYRALRASLFPRLTREQLLEDMDWLRTRGMVTNEWVEDELLVSTLTARGLDAARGDIEVKGVAKPRRIK